MACLVASLSNPCPKPVALWRTAILGLSCAPEDTLWEDAESYAQEDTGGHGKFVGEGTHCQHQRTTVDVGPEDGGPVHPASTPERTLEDAGDILGDNSDQRTPARPKLRRWRTRTRTQGWRTCRGLRAVLEAEKGPEMSPKGQVEDNDMGPGPGPSNFFPVEDPSNILFFWSKAAKNC